MNYMDIKKASLLWDLSQRRITTLCRNGRIEGAKKENGIWFIPINTQKPLDGRKTKTLQLTKQKKLPMPVGISDYKKIVTDYYYVDKTLLLKDFLDSKPQVTLFTRPRRFGKTLTMDMIKTFFEISDMDTSQYFINQNIWRCGIEYQKEQGQYPVIFISFKDIKFSTWEKTLESIADVIATEYARHSYLLQSDACNLYEKNKYRSIIDKTASEVILTSSLKNLSDMLSHHYQKNVIIIIDEYDTPIQQGYLSHYYDQVIDFMRNLLSAALKDNTSLAYGFMTGILKVAKESIFSGLNNITTHSILEKKYDEYFGFTPNEVYQLCQHYDIEDHYTSICDWYNGYYYGHSEIFNPWSIINYFYHNFQLKPYWISTGDNSIIAQIVSEANQETIDNLQDLMQGKTISTYIDTSIIYPEIKKNPSSIYSFLLASGYLKIVNFDTIHEDQYICEIAIPNKEIAYVFQKEIISALSNIIPQQSAIMIQKSLITHDTPALQKELQNLLLNSISSFDYAQENFYHGLMLGICTILSSSYHIDSNKESGYGRYDIQLKPKNLKLPGILFELKVVNKSIKNNDIEMELEKNAQEALLQINTKNYSSIMKQEGVLEIIKFGVAFYKKQIKILSQIEKP